MHPLHLASINFVNARTELCNLLEISAMRLLDLRDKLQVAVESGANLACVIKAACEEAGADVSACAMKTLAYAKLASAFEVLREERSREFVS